MVLVFAISASMSAINGFHQPALAAMTQELVSREDQSAAAALGSLRFNLGAIGGPACGGLIIAKFGLSAATSSTWLLWRVADLLGAHEVVASQEAHSDVPTRQHCRGLRYAVRRPELIGTYVVDIVAMIFAMPMAFSRSWASAGPALPPRVGSTRRWRSAAWS